jgi:protein SCO1/2
MISRSLQKPSRQSKWLDFGGSGLLAVWSLMLAVCLLCSCSAKTSSTNAPAPASTNLQTFQVNGVVTKLLSDGKSIEIRHEEVPNFMPAMTMPFEVKNPKELAGLKVNDSVSFRLSVTDSDSWIDQIKKTEAKSLTELPSTNGFRFVHDVEPLQVGDPLPEYHFTNQLGQTVSTSQFKGQAIALTFIFTRCPLPNFCPRMSSNFEHVQAKLAGSAAIPSSITNWHLLTISFDPEFDTPAVLKSYAERYHADSAHWMFLTGSLADIRAISDQFGQSFWKDETGAINHNLRTVVVNSSGRIQKIFTGNNWTSDELASSLSEAAAAAR